MNRSQRFFKVTSILMLIAGLGAVFVGVLILIAGIILLVGSKDNPGLLSSLIGQFAGTGIVIAVVGGILQFITGVFSLKSGKKHEKSNTFIILGIITAALHIASQVWDILSVGFHTYSGNIAVYVGLVIPAVYIISAVQLKHRGESHVYKSSGLSKITEFFIVKKERIYEILFTLIICGIIGWAVETIEVWIHFGTLTARGMLFISRINGFPILWGLPFILMYGIGGAVLIWCFKPLAKEPVILFFVGMFVLTIFEYATSVFCEDVLGMKLWDYSKMFLNFQGRVCLSSSLAWGVLSVISVKLLAPLFDRVYNKIQSKHKLHIVIVLFMVFIVVCYILRPFLNVEQY